MTTAAPRRSAVPDCPPAAAGLPPSLLCTPHYLGTLAAVRDLGRRGSRVTVASPDRFSISGASRYCARRLRCPPEDEPAAFIEWLLDFGRREPGHFLYPTSDALAYLFARHAAELRNHFVLRLPPVETLVNLLDKKRLQKVCENLGIPVAPTWLFQSANEIERAAPELCFPVFLKPRTQVMLISLHKGTLAHDAAELRELFAEAAVSGRYLPEVRHDFGDISHPMVQSYFAQSSTQTYSLAGFVDERGELLGVRASVKVLQWPRRIGIGLCFEEAEILPSARKAVVDVARATGYFGVFETEFILDGECARMIDFNPRFYGQMGFELSRGLPLVAMALALATGDSAGLQELARSASSHTAGCPRVQVNGFFLALLLGMRGLMFHLDAGEKQRWRAWRRAHSADMVDAVDAPDDRRPRLVQVLSEVRAAVRHPRAFLRNLRD